MTRITLPAAAQWGAALQQLMLIALLLFASSWLARAQGNSERASNPEFVFGPGKSTEAEESEIRALALKGPVAVPILRRALSDPELQHSSVPLRVVQRLGPTAASLVPDLIERLEWELAGRATSFAVTWHSIEALKQIGPAARASLPVLDQLLRRSDARGWELQLKAIEALVAIGPTITPELTSSLEFGLRHSNNTVSRAAAEGVRRFRARRSARVVAELLERDHQTRQVAVEVLVGLGRPSQREVHPFLKSPDPEVRIAALRVLGQVPSPDSLSQVLNAVEDPDPRVEAAAHHALHCLVVSLPATDTSWLVPRYLAWKVVYLGLVLLAFFLLAWRVPRQRPTRYQRALWLFATLGISGGVASVALSAAFSQQWVRLALPRSGLLVVNEAGAILLTTLLFCALGTTLAYLKKPTAAASALGPVETPGALDGGLLGGRAASRSGVVEAVESSQR